MKKQRGMALSGLLFWGVIVALVAMLAIKVAPSAIEYYKILKDAKATASTVPSDATVAQVRAAFAKYAEVDHLSDVSPADLEVSKDGGRIVISFAYEKRIPLVANVALVINYQGSSDGN